jgi:hypothetical protein
VRVVHGGQDIPHAFCISEWDHMTPCRLSVIFTDHGEQLAEQCYEWLVAGGFV